MSEEKYTKIIQALLRNRYHVTFFETAQAAAAYLTGEILKLRDSVEAESEQDKIFTVGFGDSKTLAALELDKRLTEHDIKVANPERAKNLPDFLAIARQTLTTDVFLTSVNAAAETGEMVNIDGTGNRVAGSLFGHKKVFFVFGTNKIAPTLDAAIYRARNVAAPHNARRHRYKTPCALSRDTGELAPINECSRCYDCCSPDRICNSLVIHMKAMRFIESEVIIIDEALGL